MIEIRQLNNLEYGKAIELSIKVFMACGSSDFDDQGWQTFTDFVNDEKLMNELTICGAFDNDVLIGIIATKSRGAHISLFFINPEYHHKGIGRKLFEYAYASPLTEKITVNSSSYAVRFYEKIGFSKTADEQETNGLRYTPMAKTSLPLGRMSRFSN